MHWARLFTVLVSLTITLPVFSQSPRDWWQHWSAPAHGPRMGVLVENLSFRELELLDLPYGVRVTRVMAGSPADVAGLRGGDILIEFDSRPVFSVARLQWLTGRTAGDGTIDLTYRRDGETVETALSFQPPATRPIPVPDFQRDWVWKSPDSLGASIQSLTAGLREALEVPEGIGALVSEVYEQGPAERADLRPGDVIIRMDRRVIRDIGDVERVLDYFESGEQITLEVIRDKKPHQLTLTLGERDFRQGSRRWHDWMDSYRDRLPFFDPDWWRDLEDLSERWRRYWEDEEQERRPPGTL